MIIPLQRVTLHKKLKFSIKDFFSKCDQIRSKLIWSHLLKKSSTENFIFCAVWMTELALTCNLKLQWFQPIKLNNSGVTSGSLNYPAYIYLLKFNNRNTRETCEICSKLTIKSPERCHWRRFGVFIVNFENISHLFLMFLLLTLSR